MPWKHITSPGVQHQEGPKSRNKAVPPKTSLSKSYFCNHLATSSPMILQALNTLYLLALVSTTLSTSLPITLMGEGRSSATSRSSAPAAGHGDAPTPREVAVNRDPERKGESHSKVGALSLPPKPQQGAQDTLESQRHFRHGCCEDISPHRGAAEAAPASPPRGAGGSAPTLGSPWPTTIPRPAARRAKPARWLAGPPPAGPGWTAPLRAPPAAAPNRPESPGQAAKGRPGTTGPGLRREGAKGPGSRGRSSAGRRGEATCAN